MPLSGVGAGSRAARPRTLIPEVYLFGGLGKKPQHVPQAVPQSMCQQVVSGVSFVTCTFIVASETATPCMKSLFYGLLETYFAVYDSVVLTGPKRP